MYSVSLYIAFVQLRKQLYKIKTRKWWDKYTKIEEEKYKYKTLEKFYQEAISFINESEIDFTIQDLFEEMLFLSQRNALKYRIFT